MMNQVKCNFQTGTARAARMGYTLGDHAYLRVCSDQFTHMAVLAILASDFLSSATTPAQTDVAAPWGIDLNWKGGSPAAARCSRIYWTHASMAPSGICRASSVAMPLSSRNLSWLSRI